MVRSAGGKEKQIYNIPVGATRWGQRGSLETFFAMIWLGVTIYPEYYADFDLKKEVTQFYDEILGLKIDDGTYDKMLSGSGIRNASDASAGEKQKNEGSDSYREDTAAECQVLRRCFY